MNEIQRKSFPQADRQQVQDDAIAAVMADPEPFIDAYKQDGRSFGGRYVAADLFKETFPAFSASKEARNRYNNPVHNAAAVLSAELFKRNLSEARGAGRDTVYFLTGSPGAGKTSMVLKRNLMPDDGNMIFEGQLSNFDTSKEKIQQVLDAGFRPFILVVHAHSQNALENTLQRFSEEGRGSSIDTIATIQSGLPTSLPRIHDHFQNRVKLEIADMRDRNNPRRLIGFEHFDILKSEGNHEQIKQRLQRHIDGLRDAGRISDEAYRQAAGLAPSDRFQVVQRGDRGSDRDAQERGSAEGSRPPTVLNGIDQPSAETLPGQAPTVTNDASALVAKEKAMREVLESEREKLGLPEPSRVDMRAQLDPVFENARLTGHDLQIPTPQVVEPEVGGTPAAPGSEPGDGLAQNPEPDR